MTQRQPIPAPIAKIGAIFQDATAITAAWEAHRPYCGRKLQPGESEPYIVSYLALQRAVRRATHRSIGYFTIDGWLIGYGGAAVDPKWSITPDHSLLASSAGTRMVSRSSAGAIVGGTNASSPDISSALRTN